MSYHQPSPEEIQAENERLNLRLRSQEAAMTREGRKADRPNTPDWYTLTLQAIVWISVVIEILRAIGDM